MFMTACGRNDSKLNIDTEEVSREIDEYMNSFIGLYTGNAFEDVLYSTIENWIIIDETIYVLHDNGKLEELEGETFDSPLPEEFLTGYEKVVDYGCKSNEEY